MLSNAVMNIDNIIQNTTEKTTRTFAITDRSAEIILLYVEAIRALTITTCKEIDRMKKSIRERVRVKSHLAAMHSPSAGLWSMQNGLLNAV